MSETIRIIHDIDEARATILKRRPLDSPPFPPKVGGEEGGPPALSASIQRIFGRPLTPAEAVAQILRDVRERGDAALLDYSRRIDGVALEALEVPREAMEAAWRNLPDALQRALALAARRIESFHRRQPTGSWVEWQEGQALGQLVRPIARVGIYVPGGTAPLPSSLLMSAIPARVAGVEEVMVATPPDKLALSREGDGQVNPVILAAAYVARVDRVFTLGGAQAIAALAYGTETVPRVDKIVGPGGLFTVLAMRQVFGTVGVAGLPGPTETLLIADDSADPAIVAADLLAQSEHDWLATAILITTSEVLAEAVLWEIEAQLPALARREIAGHSLASQGGIVVVPDLETAVQLADEFAPEHLCLLTRDPWSLVGRVHNAGGIFVGEVPSEALGDYIIGPSHVMPTGGTARFASPLNVADFLKVTSIFSVDQETMLELTPAAIELAEAEGLTAHAAALRARQSRKLTS